jgi:hypothetical protein
MQFKLVAILLRHNLAILRYTITHSAETSTKPQHVYYMDRYGITTPPTTKDHQLAAVIGVVKIVKIVNNCVWLPTKFTSNTVIRDVTQCSLV